MGYKGLPTDNRTCPVCGGGVKNVYSVKIKAGKSILGTRWERIEFCSEGCKSEYIQQGNLVSVEWER